MFNTAGLKIAMGNSVPELKEKADFVTGSNNRNGVAEAVERYILAQSGT